VRDWIFSTAPPGEGAFAELVSRLDLAGLHFHGPLRWCHAEILHEFVEIDARSLRDVQRSAARRMFNDPQEDFTLFGG
jgi:hypothetical protein